MFAIQNINRAVIRSYHFLKSINLSKQSISYGRFFSVQSAATHKHGNCAESQCNRKVTTSIASSNVGSGNNRHFSTGADNESGKYQRGLPKFSDQDVIVAPSLIQMFKNYYTAWQIRNKFDSDFSLSEFVQGTKQALGVVSQKLSVGDFDGLRGLVDEDTLSNMEMVFEQLTLSQRQELEVNPMDICKVFVQNVEFTGDSTVEIFMVYHTMRGMNDFKEGNISPEEFVGDKSSFLDKNLYVINYKFAKDFSKGADGEWTITSINHVRMVDEMMEQQKEIRQLFQKLKEEKDKDKEK